MERVAVLTENIDMAPFAARSLGDRAEAFTEELRRMETDKIPVLPVYFAKGMEYDGVIALDTGKNSLIHYVLSTRALHRLVHLHIKED